MTDNIYNWENFIPQELLDLAPDGNNYALFKTLVDYGIDIYQNINKTQEWLSIDKASGVALDKIGANFEEYRGEADDNFFRFMIKSKILSSRSKGTANDIINVISKSLNVDISKIIVREAREYSTSDKKFVGDPFTILVEKLPLSFTANDFQKRYLIKRIEDTAAEGIKVGNISFLDFGNATLYIGAAQSMRKKYTQKKSIYSTALK